MKVQVSKFKVQSSKSLAIGHWPFARRAREGITLLLSLTMLGGLVLITASAANLVITVSRSSRTIGNSEIAYFAAEAAVERALLEFEKNGASLGALTTGSLTLPSNPAATYTTSATMELFVPPDDTLLDASDPTQSIQSSNPLLITLAPNKTFFLDFATNGSTYSSNLNLDIPNGKPATVIIFESNTQTKTNYLGTGSSIVIANNLAAVNNARLTIKNTDTTASVFEIKPSTPDLPLGVLITGIGSYRGTERRIEVFRPNYVFY